MRTSTITPEAKFFVRLEEVLAERHPGLRLEPPPGRAGGKRPLPDIVITNPRTGFALGGEVRAGYEAKGIPMTLLPHLDDVRRGLQAEYDPSAEVVVITTGEIPQPLRGWLDQDGVEYFEVSSPEEAIERLESRLERL
jgi:hypothetical protein